MNMLPVCAAPSHGNAVLVLLVFLCFCFCYFRRPWDGLVGFHHRRTSVLCSRLPVWGARAVVVRLGYVHMSYLSILITLIRRAIKLIDSTTPYSSSRGDLDRDAVPSTSYE
jgi:hypothetical protein